MTKHAAHHPTVHPLLLKEYQREYHETMTEELLTKKALTTMWRDYCQYRINFLQKKNSISQKENTYLPLYHIELEK
jgi:hypothetical protein